MTLDECTALLTPLALAMRADLDKPTFRAYHALLKNVPATLGAAALEDLTGSGMRFFPSAPEILTASEKARRRLLALNPYEGCAECEDQKGYRTIQTEGQQKAVEPCPCKRRHQQRLAVMGVLEAIALMPGEAESQVATSYPTLEQIPARMRESLTAMAERKRLR